METPRRALQDYRLRQAIQWVSERLDEQPQADRGKLVNEAAWTYALSPRQEDFLYHLYCQPV